MRKTVIMCPKTGTHIEIIKMDKIYTYCIENLEDRQITAKFLFQVLIMIVLGMYDTQRGQTDYKEQPQSSFPYLI